MIKKILSKLIIKEVYVNSIIIYTFFYILMWIYILYFGIVFTFEYNFYNLLFLALLFLATQFNLILTCRDEEIFIKRILASFCLSFVILTSEYVPDIILLKYRHSDMIPKKVYAKIVSLKPPSRKSSNLVYYESEMFSSSTTLVPYFFNEIEKNGKDRYYLEIFYYEKNGLIYTKDINVKKKFTIIINCQLYKFNSNFVYSYTNHLNKNSNAIFDYKLFPFHKNYIKYQKETT